jgi:hypothetical protein
VFTFRNHVVLLFSLACSIASAHASAATISGAVWSVSSAQAQNAVSPSVPATPANITFAFTTSAALNFRSNDDLSAYAFFEYGGVPAGAFVGPDISFDNTLTTLTVNNFDLLHDVTFALGHDDGVSMYLNGVAFYSSPGGTVFKQSYVTYTGPTVTGTLEIVYGECCTPPAIFVTNLPTGGGTPEPRTFLLFASGLVTALVSRRKF